MRIKAYEMAPCHTSMKDVANRCCPDLLSRTAADWLLLNEGNSGENQLFNANPSRLCDACDKTRLIFINGRLIVDTNFKESIFTLDLDQVAAETRGM